VSISFYEALLPPIGPYCALSITSSEIVHQTFHPNVAELLARTDSITKAGHHAYIAMSSFKDSSSRKATNAHEIRCFFLDLDCGPNKDFDTQQGAYEQLVEIIERYKLPTPFIVDSGRGVHVYWMFAEAVPVAQWKQVAAAFKKICQQDGFPIDPNVPADSARVMRVVGSLNIRTDPPTPVVVMAEGEITSLEAFRACLPVEVETAPMNIREAMIYGEDDFTKGIAKVEFPPSEFARLVRVSLKGQGCAQITHALQEAATLSEPLWRAALAIAWRCTDAETAIHRLSRDHPEYTFEGTLAKAELTKGPMTCEWYRGNGGGKCAGCKHQITSPIQLGRKVTEAEIVDGHYEVQHQLGADNTEEAAVVVRSDIPAFPFPYFRPDTGGVWRKTRDKDGNPGEAEVYQYDLYITSRFFDSDLHGDGEGELVGVALHTPRDGIRRFVAPVGTLLTREKMRDLLLKNGVVAINNELDGILTYFASSIRNLQKQFSADKTRSQMGWTPDDSGFVVGEIEYTATGVRLAPPANATKLLAPFLVPKGSLEEWSKIANFYNRPGMEAHALTLLFGFGAPLLRILGGMEVRGATINLMSNKSGTGKTTAQMLVNSIFGNPSELLLKKSDTTMSKMQWLGMMNNIAVTMDEVTNMTDEEVSELVYDVPQGRGKHRMESQSNKLRANVLSWMTFVITSSNSSLYDKLGRLKSTADGELRRLIEMRILRPIDTSKKESDRILGALDENYGVAGPVYMKYVLNHRSDITSSAERIQTGLDRDMNLNQSDRFYSKILTCAFVAGHICNKLGILDYDLKRLYAYAMETILGIRETVVEPASNITMVAQEALMDYINENINNGLIVAGEKSATGLPSAPLREPKGPLRFRYEPDTQELWIPSTALRNHFVGKQVDIRQAVKEFFDAGFLKSTSAGTKRVGAGAVANLSALPIRCYCFDGKAMGLDVRDLLNADAKKSKAATTAEG